MQSQLFKYDRTCTTNWSFGSIYSNYFSWPPFIREMDPNSAWWWLPIWDKAPASVTEHPGHRFQGYVPHVPMQQLHPTFPSLGSAAGPVVRIGKIFGSTLLLELTSWDFPSSCLSPSVLPIHPSCLPTSASVETMILAAMWGTIWEEYPARSYPCRRI